MTKAPLYDQAKAAITSSSEDLSMMTKFIIFGLIIAACYGYVRAHSPRRTPAGRHGAYEKGALP
jgi:hypothetical protein